MRTFLIAYLATFTVVSAVAQSAPNYWQTVEYNQIWLPENAETVFLPPDYKLLSLDFTALASHLRTAPAEGSSEAREGALQIQLPLPDGTLETFKVWDSPVMHPELAARYPMIRSFVARGITNPHHTARLGYGPDGFRAVILSENGGSLVFPYASNQTQYYVCAPKSNVLWDALDAPPVFVKYVDMEGNETVLDPAEPNDQEITLRGGGEGNLTTRREYRFALAATGEFAQNHGGTMVSVMNALVAATEALNSVVERDADFRLILIPDNDELIFLSAANDPYENANNGGALLGQNEDVLNQIVGLSSFDIGHVFTGGCTDVGGVVSGQVCSAGKARGVTCHGSSNVVAVTLSIAAHEMGHQYTAGHTFNKCSQGTQGQYSSTSAWEPGSGSTILSYQGACGQNNINGAASVHYHGGTVQEYWDNTHFGGGNICPNKVVTSNHAPVVSHAYENGFYIPRSTPFELIASASDEDGDPLTYAWEQMNLGPQSDLGSPMGNAPSFRVFDPSTSPKRTFPRLPTLLNNGSENTEVLPTYSRNLKFRVTVRDNNVDEGAGGITWEDVSFEVDGNAGPFRVTYPDVNTPAMAAGEEVEVTWNVANTDNDLVKCYAVNIKLSVDGGQTYPYTLACSSPNDGVEKVFLPEVTTNTARIRVEAAENIFFDISNQSFAIQQAVEPGFSLSLCSQYQQICVPDDAVVEFQTVPVLNFDEPVNFEVLSGLPTGVTVDFTQNPVAPGESAIATFDMSSVTADGTYEIEVRAIAGTDTVYRKLFFNIVYSDFSALKGLSPTDGQSGLGLLPSFSWTDLPHADSYEFQLATDPSFQDSTILDEYIGTESTFTPTNISSLLENTLYFWRVRAVNECGKHEYAPTQVFQTFTVSCAGFPSVDIPKNIPSVGLPTIISEMPVIQSGTITDLNLKNLKGTHDALADLRLTLTSPAGTTITLFEGVCGNVSQFNMNLNDEAPFGIGCPPNLGQTYKPQEPLSTFIGENTLGTWKLGVEVINTLGQGGILNSWTLEFCGNISPVSPILVQSDTLFTQPLEQRTIYNYQLIVQDDDTPDQNLTFRIVNNTQHGYVSRGGVQLGIGSTFTMSDIHAQQITYTNTNPDAEHDFFTFIVEDGTGGWLGTPKFNIVITDNAPSAVEDEDFANSIQLFPNPASQLLNVNFQQPLNGGGQLFVSDVQGRMVFTQPLANLEQQVQLNTGQLASGMYILTVRTESGVFAKKFMIQQ